MSAVLSGGRCVTTSCSGSVYLRFKLDNPQLPLEVSNVAGYSVDYKVNSYLKFL